MSVALLALLTCGRPLAAQTLTKWEIVDNSFLLEEAFNQEQSVFQNIGTWTVGSQGSWQASFTQEWPLGGRAHQFSYTLPFAAGEPDSGVGDVLLNYRFQVQDESDTQPAIAPRLSVVLPTRRHRIGRRRPGLQVNVPVSKQFGNIYGHANAGFTWLPDIETTVPQLAVSGIWRAARMLNLMLEALLDETTLTLSPGLRRGWNIGEGQIVIGAALPLSSGDKPGVAFLSYFSYELPFQ